MKKNKREYFRELVYTTNYGSFDEFYTENKSEIYRTIVDIFNEYKSTDKKVLTFSLSALITNIKWITEFSFTKDQFFVMKRDVLPYFEEMEDYEMCTKIMCLDKELLV